VRPDVSLVIAIMDWYGCHSFGPETCFLCLGAVGPAHLQAPESEPRRLEMVVVAMSWALAISRSCVVTESGQLIDAALEATAVSAVYRAAIGPLHALNLCACAAHQAVQLTSAETECLLRAAAIVHLNDAAQLPTVPTCQIV